ncbi:hypothetical protein HPB47_018440 [Ixodes persulcatus]|uniref:Uncharacterized protein n=1 Tax=Ixodes persulcatus TaxID=34615 RepID=A0AC60QMN9_IXOPE|nr:hypothetical protein HPB47_018440 [Ixodes persulcatus]
MVTASFPSELKAMDGTEDATSLSQHEKWLCVEGRKESADEGQVLVRMEVTRSARAASLAKLSVLDAVKKYPYLMTSERFLRDFEMLVNREALSCIQGGLDKLAQCVLQGTLPCKRHHLQSLLESAQHGGCKRRKTHVQAVQVLRLLTVHVKEKKAMDALFLQASHEVLCSAVGSGVANSSSESP